MRFAEGHLILGRVAGIPIRVHWSFPLGMWILSGMRWAPGVALGYFVLILVHELGHGALARKFDCEVTSIDVHGLGGVCAYRGRPSPVEASIIAWGGVLAQGILFVLVISIAAGVGSPNTAFMRDVHRALTEVNGVIAAFNLIPFPGFDGHRAWRLPGLLLRGEGRSKTDSKGLAQKLADREPGPYAEPEARKPVARIERGPDGEIRVVVDENATEGTDDEH